MLVKRHHIDITAGQIVLMSSLAGFGPLPSSAPYSASKAAIKTYGGMNSILKYSSNANSTFVFTTLRVIRVLQSVVYI